MYVSWDTAVFVSIWQYLPSFYVLYSPLLFFPFRLFYLSIIQDPTQLYQLKYAVSSSRELETERKRKVGTSLTGFITTEMKCRTILFKSLWLVLIPGKSVTVIEKNRNYPTTFTSKSLIQYTPSLTFILMTIVKID